MDQRFDGQIVLITGATGGLGPKIAAAFSRRGAHVALLGRSRDKLDKVAASLDGPSTPLVADLLDDQAVQQAVAQLSRVDVLVNAAGAFHMGERAYELTDATFDKLMDANAKTVLHMTRAVVPGMVERGAGKVVNVGAYAAQQAPAKMNAYTAAKAAVLRLTESLAEEVKSKGVNVNAVLPTIIDSDENRQAMPKADPAKWVNPERLAETIVFLASEAAGDIHGAGLPVRGRS